MSKLKNPTIIPILLAVVLFIFQAAKWVFPKVVPLNSYQSNANTSGDLASGSTDFITFQIIGLEFPNDQSSTEEKPVQIYVAFYDDETVWGYHFPFGDDVFLLPPEGGIIPLGKNSGSAETNSIGDKLEVHVVVIESDLGSEQVLDDVFNLLANVIASDLQVSRLWDIVVNQATSVGTEELVGYVTKAAPVDEVTLLLERSDDWQVGEPQTIASDNNGFNLTYQVISSNKALTVEVPLVVTATPIFNVPTSTPHIVSSSSITLLSSNNAINNNDQAEIIKIPAGIFPMGLTPEQVEYLYSLCDSCNTNIFQFSQPVHEVYLDEYWIYQTEVTVEQYKLCVAAGACLTPHELSSTTIRDYFNNPRDQEAPVINVDWDMANDYCSWAGGRLPTEAEWEKAARGTDGRLFPWGDQLPNSSLANVKPYDGDVAYVGKYPKGASPYGVLDMAGNVYEWVSDWYHDKFYETDLASSPNPTGPPNFEGQYYSKVVRGGSFSFEDVIASSGLHDWYEKAKYGNGVGFRCAIEGQ